ncbi:MAG: prepilin peptidase [Myxococcota bacterium]|nr:prepilin peptidase [Myxococcota bacterium]
MSWTIDIFAFLFGAAWGSFLNVLIYRLPNKLSLIRPNSFCPKCSAPIKPYDNVPIVAWFYLRGKCRACSAPISWRYPAIEALMALLSLLLAIKVFHPSLDALVLGTEPWWPVLLAYFSLFFFVAALVALFFIDLDVTELPPEITVPGIAVGLLFAELLPELGRMGSFVPNISLFDAVLGALIGGGLILLLIVGYFLATGRVGMGGGDIWMMAMVGAFLGWQSLLFIFLASSVQGIAVALLGVALGAKQRSGEQGGLFRNQDAQQMQEEVDTAVRGAAVEQAQSPDEGLRKLAIPFGPFIAISALEYVFLGEWVLPWLTAGVVGPNGFLSIR